MKVFIWQCVSGVTDNYHDGGGAVVVAATLEEARRLLRAYPGVQDDCGAFTEAPHVIDLIGNPGDRKPYALTFRDTGCC